MLLTNPLLNPLPNGLSGLNYLRDLNVGYPTSPFIFRHVPLLSKGIQLPNCRGREPDGKAKRLQNAVMMGIPTRPVACGGESGGR